MTAPAAGPVGAPGWLAEARNHVLVVATGSATASEIEAAIKDGWTALAALEAVLARHRKVNGGPPGYVDLCAECLTKGEVTGGAVSALWTCRTVRDLEAALRGAQGGAGG